MCDRYDLDRTITRDDVSYLQESRVILLCPSPYSLLSRFLFLFLLFTEGSETGIIRSRL